MSGAGHPGSLVAPFVAALEGPIAIGRAALRVRRSLVLSRGLFGLSIFGSRVALARPVGALPAALPWTMGLSPALAWWHARRPGESAPAPGITPGTAPRAGAQAAVAPLPARLTPAPFAPLVQPRPVPPLPPPGAPAPIVTPLRRSEADPPVRPSLTADRWAPLGARPRQEDSISPDLPSRKAEIRVHPSIAAPLEHSTPRPARAAESRVNPPLPGLPLAGLPFLGLRLRAPLAGAQPFSAVQRRGVAPLPTSSPPGAPLARPYEPLSSLVRGAAPDLVPRLSADPRSIPLTDRPVDESPSGPLVERLPPLVERLPGESLAVPLAERLPDRSSSLPLAAVAATARRAAEEAVGDVVSRAVEQRAVEAPRAPAAARSSFDPDSEVFVRGLLRRLTTMMAEDRFRKGLLR